VTEAVGNASTTPDGPAAGDPDGPAAADGPAVLELRDVSAAYGPFRALFGVSLTVGPGEAVALLGANGAGKTTVARVATGLVAPTSGSVLVEGQDFTGSGVFKFARAGVAHAPEGRSVFATLTVEENLTLSFRQSKGRGGVSPGLEQAFGMFPVLGERRRQLAGTLSGGEQRMLSMARVLVESPAVLVADELSLGLAPKIVDGVYESLAKLREQGSALLIVEQHVGHALDLCDRVAQLHHGTVTWEGPSDHAADRVMAELFDPAGP
jgi:branched-chain amino acid transport system ATP-binding protein